MVFQSEGKMKTFSDIKIEGTVTNKSCYLQEMLKEAFQRKGALVRE